MDTLPPPSEIRKREIQNTSRFLKSLAAGRHPARQSPVNRFASRRKASSTSQPSIHVRLLR